MTGRVRAARLTAAIEHVTVTGADDRALRARILDVIKGFVPFDAYAFLLTDPVTSVGCSPVAEVPNLRALPDLIRLKYLTPVNRWTGLPADGCATLQHATGGRPEESLLWREHLSGLGILDVVSVVFRDRFGWWGFLDLWRRESRFADDEVISVTRTLLAADVVDEIRFVITPTIVGSGQLLFDGLPPYGSRRSVALPHLVATFRRLPLGALRAQQYPPSYS